MHRNSNVFRPCLALFFLISTLTLPTHTAKILGLFAHPGESHFAVMQTIVLELARREHNVTVYSSHRMHEHPSNIVEYIIEPEYPFWKELQKAAGIKEDTMNGGLQELSQLTPGTLQKHLGVVGAQAVDHFLEHQAVKDLIQTAQQSINYDLIIVDLFYTEALLAIGHYLNISTIGIVSTNFENYMQLTLENMLPIACSPIDFENYSSEAGYWQRLSTTRDCIARRKQFTKSNFAAQEQLIKKHFKHFQQNSAAIPSITQLQAELAILLLNNYVPLTASRPLLPNTIAAGGLHIRQARELPWHIRRFLDEARNGVIYINLGNEQLCGELPKKTLEFYFKVLGQRQQRVLWTCHDVENLENAPTNFMFQHVVPQTDILAHPHIRTFLMNGDLLSLQDGIMRHVPMIGVPIFRNELHNMKLAEKLGIGISIESTNFTATVFNQALDFLMFDSNYALTIRKVATEFRDRPMGALESTIYWIDYVLRYNGGEKLKTKGIGIPSNQLHLFDLFMFYFIIALAFVGTLVGAYFGALYFWQTRATQKMYSKLN